MRVTERMLRAGWDGRKLFCGIPSSKPRRPRSDNPITNFADDPYYFNVDSIDAAAARVRKGGGNVINGPMQVPSGSWIIHCLDPRGAMFALVGPKR